MKLKQRIIATLSFLVAIMGLQGCNTLKDDLSVCDLFLQFRYDYNLPNQDWFSEQVEEVHVFIFDAKGGYIRTLSEKGEALTVAGYKMAIPLDLKGSTMVVWAGKVADDYQLPTLSVGDPIEKLTLHYKPIGNASNRHIAALWHSGPHVMTFTENGGTTQTVSLLRDTNEISISICSGDANNEKYCDPNDYDITIVGANGEYNHENNFITPSPKITYSAASYTDTAAKLHTLRLVKGEQITLYITDKSTGRHVTAKGSEGVNLIELLLLNKPSGMGDQEYLDRRYIWDLRFGIDTKGYIAINFIINDWTYWFQPIDL